VKFTVKEEPFEHYKTFLVIVNILSFIFTCTEFPLKTFTEYQSQTLIFLPISFIGILIASILFADLDTKFEYKNINLEYYDGDIKKVNFNHFRKRFLIFFGANLIITVASHYYTNGIFSSSGFSSLSELIIFIIYGTFAVISTLLGIYFQFQRVDVRIKKEKGVENASFLPLLMAFGGKSIINTLVSILWIISSLLLFQQVKKEKKFFKKLWDKKEEVADELYQSYYRGTSLFDYFIITIPLLFVLSSFFVYSTDNNDYIFTAIITVILLLTFFLRKRWIKKKSKKVFIEKIIFLIILIVATLVIFYYLNESFYTLFENIDAFYPILFIKGLGIYNFSVYYTSLSLVVYFFITIAFYRNIKSKDDFVKRKINSILSLEIFIQIGSLLASLFFYFFLEIILESTFDRILTAVIFYVFFTIILYKMTTTSEVTKIKNMPKETQTKTLKIYQTGWRKLSIFSILVRRSFQKIQSTK